MNDLFRRAALAYNIKAQDLQTIIFLWGIRAPQTVESFDNGGAALI
jgi:hypothetical protein